MTGFGLLVLPTVQTDAWILTCLHLIRAKAICYPLWHQMKNFTGYGGPYVNMTSANQSKLRGYMYFNGYNFFNIYTTFAYFQILVKIVLFQKQRCLDLIIICMWHCIHCFVKVNRFQTYSHLFMFGYKHIKYKHFYICTALEILQIICPVNEILVGTELPKQLWRYSYKSLSSVFRNNPRAGLVYH